MQTENRTKIDLSVRSSDNVNDRSLYAGDWIEVRTKNEILKTLDKNGQLDGMPFMPEMFAFCGRRLRVYKRAHKTCDTVNDYKGRKMKDAVHLESVRCSGLSHGGCEAGCLIFWKSAWLKKVSDISVYTETEPFERGSEDLQRRFLDQCTEADVLAGTQRKTGSEGSESAYVCQATQVPAATEPLSPWAVGQYIEDYTSGNIGLGRMASGFIYMAYRHWLINLGIGIGPALRWLYDNFQSLRGGVPYPRRHGKIPVGERTPTTNLDLQPGEWVRVKSLHEILATCDTTDSNRGMKWDAELVPYCGGTYKVLKRVTKILNEKTGKMQKMKTPCIILDGVACQARYSECRLFCPRSIYTYWREIWLERVNEDAAAEGAEVHKRALYDTVT